MIMSIVDPTGRPARCYECGAKIPAKLPKIQERYSVGWSWTQKAYICLECVKTKRSYGESFMKDYYAKLKECKVPKDVIAVEFL